MDINSKSNGATVGLIVIVVLLMLGGVYTWHSMIKNQGNNQQIFAPITIEDEAELDNLLEELGTEQNPEVIDIQNLE